MPRRLQISIRRAVVLYKRKYCGNVWPVDETAGTMPLGWSGWFEGKRFALVLMHDVDTKAGHEKCSRLMEIEQGFGFRSSFNFVPERYDVSPKLRQRLTDNGFEVGVHGLKHDGRLFKSERIFKKRAARINRYLHDWSAAGFSSPSMHRNLSWMHALNMNYATTTFDTDPFEPQPGGVGKIFPFAVRNAGSEYIELPYTLPQDFTLFVIMKEKGIDIWKKKLEWIVHKGGMALLNTHPDYMNFGGKRPGMEEYFCENYIEFLAHISRHYSGEYWNALPGEVARFYTDRSGNAGKL